MDSHELIDAQFDRAVEIVQGLPKTGPIQTDYEEKLTMYRWDTLQLRGYHVYILINLNIVCISRVLFSDASLSCLSHPSFTATVGNVKSPRPGIGDMLGRAKW